MAQVANPAAKARATETTRDFQVKVFKSSGWREAMRLLGSELGMGSAGPHCRDIIHWLAVFYTRKGVKSKAF